MDITIPDEKGLFCTDLVPLAPGILDQYVIARTRITVSLIDIAYGRAYSLVVQPNPLQKFEKLTVINHGLTKENLTAEKNLDKVLLSIIYTVERSSVKIERQKDPNKEGIITSMFDKKLQNRKTMFSDSELPSLTKLPDKVAESEFIRKSSSPEISRMSSSPFVKQIT